MCDDETTARELWAPIAGYEGAYDVSSIGRVRSLPRTVAHNGSRPGGTARVRGRILRPKALKDGHLTVALCVSGERKFCYVHHLVLEAFVGPAPAVGMHACHNNGVPSDNRVENLRWGTVSDNMYDSVRHGTHVQARKTHCPKGHPLSGDNLIYYESSGRQCRTCVRDYRTRYRARLRERRSAS